jgi:SET domain-containing protein
MQSTRVVESPGRGRGVVATRPIREGEVIERAPVIVIPGPEWDHMAETSLAEHCFSWGEGLADAAVVFGHGSFYNHSYSPNARFVRRLAEQAMEYVARRDIDEGEEITINYHEGQESRAPLWFDVA